MSCSPEDFAFIWGLGFLTGATLTAGFMFLRVQKKLRAMQSVILELHGLQDVIESEIEELQNADWDDMRDRKPRPQRFDPNLN